MSNSITTGVDVSKLLEKSIYDPANLNVLSAVTPRRFGCKYVASNVIRGSNDPEQSAGSTLWSKRNTLRLNFHEQGSIRISFDLWNDTVNHQVSGQLRRNGVVLGTQRDTNSLTPVTFIEDFNMSQFVEGDVIEVWVKSSQTGVWAFVRNLRILHDIIPIQKEMYTIV